MPYSRRQFLATSTLVASQLLLGRMVLADSYERRRTLSSIELRALENEIAQYPAPLVTPIGTNEAILWPFNYRRLISTEPVPVYAIPNGNLSATIPAGFNYVTILDSQDGWVQINYDQWVTENYIAPARISPFHGVTFNQIPLYQLGWLLLDSQPSPRPGSLPSAGAPMIERYTTVNIYARQAVGDWDWYLVGPSQWVEQRRIGKAVPTPPPQGVSGRWISVDLYEQVLIAYENASPVFATLVSSGLEDWPTDEGLFQIDPTLRFESTPMRGALGGPDSYIIEDIPWTMFYNTFSEEALHGTYWHDGFGYRHSHGCVNLSITDARWLYHWTAQGFENAWVYVHSTGEY